MKKCVLLFALLAIPVIAVSSGRAARHMRRQCECDGEWSHDSHCSGTESESKQFMRNQVEKQARGEREILGNAYDIVFSCREVMNALLAVTKEQRFEVLSDFNEETMREIYRKAQQASSLEMDALLRTATDEREVSVEREGSVEEVLSGFDAVVGLVTTQLRNKRETELRMLGRI